MTDTGRALNQQQDNLGAQMAALAAKIQSSAPSSPEGNEPQTPDIVPVMQDTPLFLQPNNGQQAQQGNQSNQQQQYQQGGQTPSLTDQHQQQAEKSVWEDDFADVQNQPSVPYERFKQVIDALNEVKPYRPYAQRLHDDYGSLEALEEARQRDLEQREQWATQKRQADEQAKTQKFAEDARKQVQKAMEDEDLPEVWAPTIEKLVTRLMIAEDGLKSREDEAKYGNLQRVETDLLKKYEYADPMAVRAALAQGGEKQGEYIAKTSHARVQSLLTRNAPTPAATQQAQQIPVPQGRGNAAVQSATIHYPHPVSDPKGFGNVLENIKEQARQQAAQKYKSTLRY